MTYLRGRDRGSTFDVVIVAESETGEECEGPGMNVDKLAFPLAYFKKKVRGGRIARRQEKWLSVRR